MWVFIFWSTTPDIYWLLYYVFRIIASLRISNEYKYGVLFGSSPFKTHKTAITMNFAVLRKRNHPTNIKNELILMAWKTCVCVCVEGRCCKAHKIENFCSHTRNTDELVYASLQPATRHNTPCARTPVRWSAREREKKVTTTTTVAIFWTFNWNIHKHCAPLPPYHRNGVPI